MVKWQSVRFRFFGMGLQVERIEGIMGVTPTVVARAGEIVNGSLIQRTNEWILDFPATEDASLPDRVLRMIDLLESRRDALVEILSTPDVSGEVAIECSPGHDENVAALFPETLDRITSIGLVLSLDLYRVIDNEED